MSEPQVSVLLADAVVLLHLAYVAFVASGYLAVPLGRVLGWRWIRNRAYRRLHVAAMALVALEAVVGLICPLTLLENALRLRAAGRLAAIAGRTEAAGIPPMSLDEIQAEVDVVRKAAKDGTDADRS